MVFSLLAWLVVLLHIAFFAAETVGWPQVFLALDESDGAPDDDRDDRDDELDGQLAAAFDWCLTPEARAEAASCAERARAAVAEIEQEFLTAVRREANP